jgi:predicted Zn-dependent protease
MAKGFNSANAKEGAAMKKAIYLTVVLTLLAVGQSIVLPERVLAITIKEEQDLSKEFLKVIFARYEMIQDPIIVNYVNQIGRRILSAVEPQPFAYQFYVIKADDFNAFASPAGHIFINSGLFEALQSEEELAGVIGHEISHVVCRHISQRIEHSKKVGMATLAGMVAGIFIGAGGAAAAGNAVALGSMATGQSLSLAYSRENERQADEIGLQYLTKAGYTGEGLLTSLEKIRSRQWFGSDQIPTYLTTHPASEDRLAYIDTWLEQHHVKPAANLGQGQAQPSQFQRIRTRLMAKFGEPAKALNEFKAAVLRDPKDPQAHYGYGIVLSRAGNQKQAAEEIKKALEKSALTPLYLLELGRIYYLDGRYAEALSALDNSAGLVPEDPEGMFYLGRTHLALEQPQDAVTALEQVVRQHENFTQAYYFLGEAYGRLENPADSHYNLGIYYSQKKDFKTAIFHLNRSLKDLLDPEKRKRAEDLIKEMEKEEKEARRAAQG